MKLTQIFLGSFLVLSLCFIAPQESYSEESEHFSTYHSDYGMKLYNEGKINLAIDQFVKSLIMDSSNGIAKETLKNILRNPQYNLKNERLTLFRFIELVDYAEFLKSRITHLNDSNKLLTDFILQNANNEDSIFEVTQDIKIQVEKRVDKFDMEPGVAKPKEIIDDMELVKMTDRFAQQKVKLTEQLDYLQGVNNQVRSIKIEVINKIREKKKQDFINKFEQELGEIKSKLDERNEALTKQDEEIGYFKEELAAVRKDYSSVQEKLGVSEKKIADLTRDLAGKTLEMYEKDRELVEKIDRMKSLEIELMDSHEKLSLVQRIIQEKDEQILNLEEESLELQNSVETDQMFGHKEMRKLNGKSMFTLNTQLQEQAESNLSKVTSLQKQLNMLNSKYRQLRTKVRTKEDHIGRLTDHINLKNDKIISFKREKDKEIFKLRKALAVKTDEIAKYNMYLLSKDHKVMELNSIIAIYKEKLNNTNGLLQEKTKKLNDLEKQFTELSNQGKISDSDEQATESEPSEWIIAPRDVTGLSLTKITK